MKITQKNLSNILGSHQGNTLLVQALERAQNPTSLLRFLTEYISFNSVFGSCVAILSGTIGLRQDIFRDPDDLQGALADRSAMVAAKIFYAAIDEFCGERCLMDHRSMAQKTLRSSAQFFQATTTPTHIKDSINEVIRGYGVGMTEKSEKAIFSGIGFHIGSEILADQEFKIIDEHLRARHVDLVEHLEKEGSYVWIQVHTMVEIEHFDAALEAANMALRYYVGDEAQARKWIMQGIKRFADVQASFFRCL
jgi:hypothetical protein